MLFALHGTFTYVNFYLAAPPFGLNSAQLGSVFLVYLLGLVVTPLSGRYMDGHGFRKTIILAAIMSLAGLALTLKLSLVVVIGGLALLSSAPLCCSCGYDQPGTSSGPGPFLGCRAVRHVLLRGWKPRGSRAGVLLGARRMARHRCLAGGGFVFVRRSGFCCQSNLVGPLTKRFL